MAIAYQIIEKGDFGTDWSPVRYNDAATKRFATEAEAWEVARNYVTNLNCENALASSEIENAAEAFLLDNEGVFLGNLNKKPLYMRYPKNVIDKKSGVTHNKGDIIKDRKYFALSGKTEVSVRVLPGSDKK